MEFKVTIKNETSNADESNVTNSETTTGQQKINKAKDTSKGSDTYKQVMTTALAVAQSGLSVYTQYSQMQSSLIGNTEYSQRVATVNSYLSKGLSVGGSFLMGTALSGGNVVVGGVSALLSIGGQVASEVINKQGIDTANAITSTANAINIARLGSANNIWRK